MICVHRYVYDNALITYKLCIEESTGGDITRWRVNIRHDGKCVKEKMIGRTREMPRTNYEVLRYHTGISSTTGKSDLIA